MQRQTQKPNAEGTWEDQCAAGDRAFVGLGAVVIRYVPARGKVSGNFAISHQRLLRATLGEEGWEK
jgi:hypothetical protein